MRAKHPQSREQQRPVRAAQHCALKACPLQRQSLVSAASKIAASCSRDSEVCLGPIHFRTKGERPELPSGVWTHHRNPADPGGRRSPAPSLPERRARQEESAASTLIPNPEKLFSTFQGRSPFPFPRTQLTHSDWVRFPRPE